MRLKMALNTIEKDEERLRVELNNGDLNTLNEIVENWKFKDEVSALRFALVALSSTKRGNLYFKQENGLFALIEPTSLITKI